MCAVDSGYKWLLAGIIAPFFWWVVLGIALWIVRRWFPQHEVVLFGLDPPPKAPEAHQDRQPAPPR